VIEAQDGIDRFSEPVQQSYRKFAQILAEKGEVDFYSLTNVLDALGLQLAVTVKSA